MEAKKAAGYFSSEAGMDPAIVVGRDLKDY
jgi:hypothetical protein